MSKIIPFTEDRDTGFFFEAAKAEKLVFRQCAVCGTGKGLHLPTVFCPDCGTEDTGWVEASGVGRLYSWTHVHHQVHPDYPAPYTIVVVELEEAPNVRMVGSVKGLPELVAGQRMEVWFEQITEDVVLPQWKPSQ